MNESTKSQTSILVVDDGQVALKTYAAAIEREPRYKIVGVANNGEIAVQKVDELHPDLVLMDVELPVMDGIEATKRIVEKHPEVRVLMISGHADESVMQACLQAGAKGYFLKSIPDGRMFEAIQAVCNGATWIDPDLDTPVCQVKGEGKY